MPTAKIKCIEPIERLAKHTMRWTDGTLEPRFSKMRWLDRPKGIVTYVGDKAEFQNGYGAYAPVAYECDVDTAAGQVLGVRAQEGRLP